MNHDLLTREPIREEKTTFASAASSTTNCFSNLCSGSIVVSHNCVGIISPRPALHAYRYYGIYNSNQLET